MVKKSNKVIEKRQKEQKSLVLEQLKKMPIIQVACERAGISRATFYRWRQKDKGFNQAVESAIKEGVLLINDLSESQLISSIRDKNMTGIIFWLKNRHEAYSDKVEVNANIKSESGTLSPEQEALIKKALSLASLSLRDKGENHVKK